MPESTTKYKDEYDNMAYRHCLLGAIDKDLASLFEVCEATINNWKIEHTTFLESLKRGKREADFEVVQSLNKNANGHITRLQKAFKVKNIEYDNNGKKISEKEEIVHDFDEVYTPPNSTSQIFWLKNRQPDKWRDKQEIDMTAVVTATKTDSFINSIKEMKAK